MANVLYSFQLAFNPPKALLVLAEKGIPKDLVDVRYMDILGGQSLQPHFMQINPKSTVPTLVLSDGTVLNETAEIVKRLDGSVGSPPLGSTGAGADRALVERWVDDIHRWDGNLHAVASADAGTRGFLSAMGHFRMKTAEANVWRYPDLADVYRAKIESIKAQEALAEDAAKVTANMKELESLLDKCEAALGSSPFLLGSDYTAADAMLTATLVRAGAGGARSRLLATRPALDAYWGRMQQRPSYKEVFEPGTVSTLSMVVPTVVKFGLARLTRWY